MIEAANLWELIEKRAAATPDVVMAVDEDNRTLTFTEFRAQAERAAAGLAQLGVAAGDVVSWQLPTWLESMALVAGLSRLGAVQNPMLPIYRHREVSFICRQAGAKLLIVPSVWRNFDYQALANEVAGELAKNSDSTVDVLVCDKSYPEGDPARLPPPPAVPSTADEAPVRWLFYTSGTTADPKGAKHTDATIMACASGMCERIEVNADDNGAMVFPFTHIGGITWMVGALQTGCKLIFTEQFDPTATTEQLAREKVTLAGAGTPFHMAYLAYQRAHPEKPIFPQVRMFPGGASPKPPQLHYDMKKELGGVGIVSGYGLTEAPIVTMASPHDSDEALAHTEGRATRGVDLIVVKLDGTRAAAGEEGEIRAKAPQLMKGYLDSTLDADAFDDEGYFRTGDLGTLDDEGNIRITGRLKDIIIRKGENISAKEVEDLLFTHPKITDAAVIGLPDPAVGERCCAVVVPSEPDKPVTLSEIGSFCKEAGLMTQKIPEQLEIVDVLPRNPTGKVIKFELRDRYARSS